jgi:NodT family efflux transporter outer membrane factor (OMF) lipoprotein
MKRFAAAVLLLMLAGCVPNGVAPQQTAIATDTLGLGATQAPPAAEDWWSAFDDPQLDRLVAQAVANNPNLGEALARLRAAKAGVASANSTLYPHLDFDAQEQRIHLSDTYIYPPPYAGTVRWLGTIDADLSWDIDFWGKEAAGLDKAKSLQGAARLDAAAACLAVTGALVQAYIDLDRAYKLADIAAQTERERHDTLSLTLRRVKDGLDSQVEEQEAKALVAQAHENRAGSDSDRDIVVHEIAALIGRGADAYPTIARPTIKLDAVLPLPDTLPADLLSRRPDVLAARARIDAALAGRKVAQAAFYPDVNLLASAGWAAIGLSPLLSATSLQYGGGPAIHLPIFDAGKLRADYAGATAELDFAIADYNDVLTSAVRQAADALTQIRSLGRQQAEHRNLLDAAETGYRLAQTRYRTGLATQLTVLNAQNILFEARTGDVALGADGAAQRVTLLLAVGGGFEPDNPKPRAAEFHSGNQDHLP